MITIRPYEYSYKNGFVVTGHAEYAEHGADIVCSAVSAMSQMTHLALKRHTDVVSVIKSGDMSVQIDKPNVYTNVLIDAMINGLRHVTKQYPQYVEIMEETKCQEDSK
jgi:uncharacterized protein YsxB (DUF464 family)